MYDHGEELNLPTDASRKDIPVYSGFIELFPLAIAAVARVMAKNQKKHGSKGWDRSKSPDHLNSMGRHLLDIGGMDTDGESHLAHLACRSLMALQIAEEARRKKKR